ncbi:MAG TPA: MFS transporter [Actinomycetota bacterium]|nr:MFS transporter [Actinomycetota bacterium]
MLLLGLLGLIIVSVPLAGGRLGRIADLRVRQPWVLAAALVAKFSVILLFPGSPGPIHAAVHVGAYVAGGWFLWVNRDLPGMLLIALGGGMNFAAIAANGGVMPASNAAFQAAGLAPVAGRFSNSAPMGDPNLGFLGDIFATPASWPLANVFSVGDIVLLLGIGVALHRACGSRLVPSGRGQFSALFAHRDFIRVWGALGVSNIGDFVYSLAVYATLAQRGEAAHALAVLLIMQVAPAALTSALGGPLIDRAPRKALLIATDLARFLAVASLLIAPHPSLVHMYVVAAALGVFGSLFQPTFLASLPNLVPKEQVVAANALVGATMHAAIMVGPVLGGLLVSHLGPQIAFGVNAASFLVSAALIAPARVPQSVRVEVGAPMRDLVEGVRYSLGTPLVRGALVVIGMVMAASYLRTPLEPLFVIRELGLRPEALGLVVGVWGLGMLLGSIAAPTAARRWRRERLLAASIALIGLSVLTASRSGSLAVVLLLWLLSGAANGLGSVAYDSLLQERTPDRLRGRVMGASEAVQQASILVGVFLSGWLGTNAGIRPTFFLSGVLLLVTAVVCRTVLASAPGRHRRRSVQRARRLAAAGLAPARTSPL